MRSSIPISRRGTRPALVLAIAAGRVPPNDVEARRRMQEQLVDGWLKNPLSADPAVGRDQSAPPGPPMVERTPWAP